MRLVSDEQLLSVLAVCLPQVAEHKGSGLQVWSADSAAGALAVLRTIGVGLLVTGTELPDATPWQMIRRVRGAFPWQKWALVAPQLCANEEVLARTLGVCRIFDLVPESDALIQLATTTRSHNTTNSLSSMSGRGRRDVSPCRPSPLITGDVTPTQSAHAAGNDELLFELTARPQNSLSSNGQERRDLSPAAPLRPSRTRKPAMSQRTIAARPNELTLSPSPSEPSRANGAPNPVARGPRGEERRD